MSDTIARLRGLLAAATPQRDRQWPGDRGFVLATQELLAAVPALLDVADAARRVAGRSCECAPESGCVEAGRHAPLEAALRRLDEVSR